MRLTSHLMMYRFHSKPQSNIRSDWLRGLFRHPDNLKERCCSVSLFKGEKMTSIPRRASRPVLAAAVISTFALALGACGGGGGSGDSGGGDESVVIGYTGPLSGGGAAYGENVQTGLQMAVDDLNKDGLEVDGKRSPSSSSPSTTSMRRPPQPAMHSDWQIRTKPLLSSPPMPGPSRRSSRSTTVAPSS